MKRFTLHSSMVFALALLGTAATLPASASFHGGRNTAISAVNTYQSVNQKTYGLTGQTPKRAAAANSPYRNSRQVQGGR